MNYPPQPIHFPHRVTDKDIIILVLCINVIINKWVNFTNIWNHSTGFFYKEKLCGKCLQERIAEITKTIMSAKLNMKQQPEADESSHQLRLLSVDAQN